MTTEHTHVRVLEITDAERSLLAMAFLCLSQHMDDVPGLGPRIALLTAKFGIIDEMQDLMEMILAKQREKPT